MHMKTWIQLGFSTYLFFLVVMLHYTVQYHLRETIQYDIDQVCLSEFIYYMPYIIMGLSANIWCVPKGKLVLSLMYVRVACESTVLNGCTYAS